LHLPFDINDRNSWQHGFAWLYEKAIKIKEAVNKILKQGKLPFNLYKTQGLQKEHHYFGSAKTSDSIRYA